MPKSRRPESNPALTRNPNGLDDFGGRLACAWRKTGAEGTDRVTVIRDLLDVNDNGVVNPYENLEAIYHMAEASRVRAYQQRFQSVRFVRYGAQE
jgi:hypothetical protein